MAQIGTELLSHKKYDTQSNSQKKMSTGNYLIIIVRGQFL